MTNRDLRGPRDGQDVIALCEQPRERNLSWSGPVGLSDPSDEINDFEDLRGVLLREAGEVGQPQVTRVYGNYTFENYISYLNIITSRI